MRSLPVARRSCCTVSRWTRRQACVRTVRAGPAAVYPVSFEPGYLWINDQINGGYAISRFSTSGAETDYPVLGPFFGTGFGIAATNSFVYFHGVGGLLGIILLGVFASTAWNPNGADGLLRGGVSFFGKQCAAALLAAVWAFVFTYGMFVADQSRNAYPLGI